MNIEFSERVFGGDSGQWRLAIPEGQAALGLTPYFFQFLLLYLWIQNFPPDSPGSGRWSSWAAVVVGGEHVVRERDTGTVCGVHL